MCLLKAEYIGLFFSYPFSYPMSLVGAFMVIIDRNIFKDTLFLDYFPLFLLLFVYFRYCFLYFLILIVFIVVQVSCLHFPCTTFPAPPSILPHFGFVYGSFIHVPWLPLPFFPLLSLSPLPSGYWKFVLYFNVSGSILLVCLFCWLGFTYRWDHMVFVFHHLAYFS